MFLARVALILGTATTMARASHHPCPHSDGQHDQPDHPHAHGDRRSLAPILPVLSTRALPNITFNYSLTDMDTILTYTPSSSGLSALTWENTFSDSPRPSLPGRSIFGRGSSLHTTSMPGSTVGFYFYGDAVYVHGNASTSARIRLTTDGANADFVPATLNETDSIAWAEVEEGWHHVMLSILDGEVSLARVTVRTGMQTQAPNFEAAKTREELFLTGSGDGTRNPFYSMSGKWDSSFQIGGNDNTPPQPLSVLNGKPGASFNVRVPDNTSYLLLNGTSQPLLSYYTVALSPPLPGSLPESTFNAQQGFCNGVNFFMTPLNPEIQYTLAFTVSGNVLTGPVGVHSMTFWSALWTKDTDPNASTSSSSPGASDTSGPSPAPTGSSKGGGVSLAGAIAGGVIGGVVVFAVLFAAWFLYRRRQRKIHHKPEDNRFVVDEVEESGGPPYYRESNVNGLTLEGMGSVASSRPSLIIDPYPYDPAARTPSGTAGDSSRNTHPLAVSTVPLSPGGAPLSPTTVAGGTIAASTVGPRSERAAHTRHGSNNRLSLATLSPEEEEILADPRPPHPGPSGSSTVSEKRALQAAARRPRTRTMSRPGDQEVDAGRVRDTVPPSYDPSWAGDYASSLASRSRANSFGEGAVEGDWRVSRGSMGSNELARIASLGNVAGMLERELEREQREGRL
ncbi:uncharacterized protein CcaverHIS019_0108760 [Cutaneotrichosporon cavernicola]|uniref:Uncharacterized protein n=1 Tax=Cutaneotrichosporon cavernicola TaxID=279322 RepID=A0AA48II22_9TREE|nr:uncharacterized protein CcaverHIS019_0108760 [Cutaneotrichosporon cavernicola]BEI88158.1 hypothetical protein CcaverHIS019_0108760 [Cutaneotrichosporon cavernicola]BEI95928.1 hypothetical protein CcaverHIS631_0108770 [Cutaneotrichosporon cavernicola]BEJ03703.1 hypothetical protein CcaverHIS641_0108780 [Cutaneotrichosporon cavernicola]